MFEAVFKGGPINGQTRHFGSTAASIIQVTDEGTWWVDRPTPPNEPGWTTYLLTALDGDQAIYSAAVIETRTVTTVVPNEETT